MRPRTIIHLALTGLAALLFVALAAAPASAHSVSSSGVVYNGYPCTLGGATLAYDHTTKTSTVTARAEARVTGGSACDTIDVFAPGHLAVRYDLLYQRTGSTTWQVCRSSGWVYNTTYTWEVSVSATFGGPQPCEPGSYGTQTTAYVWDGSAWHGGTRWSGTHPMPA
jgi:hypothetical protein